MKRQLCGFLRFFSMFAAAVVPVAVSGQIMLSPVAVVGTDLGTFSEETPLVNLINQSGVDKPFVSGTTDFNTYFAVPFQTFATNGGPNNWQSEVTFNLPLKGYVDFDLGASRRVSRLAIWTVTAKDVSLSFSEDLAGLAAAPVAGKFLLNNHASYPFSYAVDVIDLATAQQGRFVRLAIDSAYLLVPGFTFTYAILGEVVLSVAPFAAPALAIKQEPNGDLTLTFGGTLEAAATADGPFVIVPGNPQTSYTLPKGTLTGAQYFRAQGQ